MKDGICTLKIDTSIDTHNMYIVQDCSLFNKYKKTLWIGS